MIHRTKLGLETNFPKFLSKMKTCRKRKNNYKPILFIKDEIKDKRGQGCRWMPPNACQSHRRTWELHVPCPSPQLQTCIVLTSCGLQWSCSWQKATARRGWWDSGWWGALRVRGAQLREPPPALFIFVFNSSACKILHRITEWWSLEKVSRIT